MSITDVANAGDAIADVEAALDHADEQEREQSLTAADHEAAQAEVLHGEDPEVIELEVAGETVACDPIGLGRRARLMRRAQQADERAELLRQAEETADRNESERLRRRATEGYDESPQAAQANVVLDMIDTLVRTSHSDQYDQDWWDDLPGPDVRSAFQALGKQSTSGDSAGK